MKKSFLTLIAVMMMAFTTKAEIIEGECGDNLTWSYDTETQILTISGTGAMWDFYKEPDYLELPWHDFDVQKAIICEGVTTITDASFSVHSIKSISMPNTLEYIGDYAFGETLIDSIMIPKSVTHIGICCFACGYQLKTIIVDPENQAYDSRENCNAIVETATNTIVTGCHATTIPNSVTAIGDYAFYYNAPSHLVIPDSVVSIGDYAYYFGGISKITFGNSLKTIGDRAFFRNIYLKNINIPNSVVSIGKAAFTWCESLDSVVLSDSMEEISARMFMSSGVNEIYFGNSIKTIGSKAFEYCYGLESIVIPNSVITIDTCAFNDDRYIKSLTIGTSVENINVWAFKGCKGLDTIHSLATIPPICECEYDIVFDDSIQKKAILYVPLGCAEAYRNADEWKDFSNIVEFIPGYGVDESIMTNTSISPNPAHNFLNINCEDMKSLEIFSIDGKLIKMMTVSGDEAQIDISDLESGVYLYSILNKKNKVVKGKFVKN